MRLRDPQPRHQEFEGGDELPERVLSVYAGAQEVLASANLRDDVLIRWSRGLDPGQRRCTVRLHDFLIKTGRRACESWTRTKIAGPESGLRTDPIWTDAGCERVPPQPWLLSRRMPRRPAERINANEMQQTRFRRLGLDETRI